MQNQKLTREYDQFIEFGNLLDRRTRQYLVEYLKHKITGQPLESPGINDRYFQYFQEALEAIFAIDNLLPLVRGNERITEHVVLDTLYWMRKTFAKAELNNPYQKETDLLAGWATTPQKAFEDRFPYLLQFLQNTYAREEIDVAFYRDRFGKFFTVPFAERDDAQRKKIELVMTDLLSQWDALLQAKILAHQIKQLNEEREQYLALLEAKVAGYKRMESLLNPITDYLGWDLSRDLWQDTSFDVLERYEDLLQNEASIRELVDLLGEMSEAEIILEEETFEKTIVRKEWVVDEQMRSEINGVHESQDLNNLLSSEVGLLGEAGTESLFLKKYVD
ncbi:MAG: hypothetical protein AAFN92_15775, partial [Bacteroidota bacterium]